MAQLINVIERKGLAKYKDGEDYFLCLCGLTVIMRDDEGLIQTFPCSYAEINNQITDDELFDSVKDNIFVDYISLRDLTNYVQRNYERRNDDALTSLYVDLYDMAVATLPFYIDEDLRKYLTSMKKFIDKILTKVEILTDTCGVV